MNCVETVLDSMFDVFLKAFWVYEPVNNLWKWIWVLEDQNLGFWVKKGWNPRVFVQNWWMFA